MPYRNITVELTAPNCSITYLFDQPAHSLPVQIKREVAGLLKQEAEKITGYANLQEQLSWEAETIQLQAEQARDLATPVLMWWESKPLTEADYYDMLAEKHGFEVAA